MYVPLARSEYYDGSAPPAPSADVVPIPSPSRWLRDGLWSDHGWFPRSLLSGRRVRHPALPLRHRHGYAVDLRRDLPTQTNKTQPGVPRPSGRVCAANQPTSTGLELAVLQEV